MVEMLDFLFIVFLSVCYIIWHQPNDISSHASSAYLLFHYENMPMEYAAIFKGCKNDYFQMKNCDIFLFLLKT